LHGGRGFDVLESDAPLLRLSLFLHQGAVFFFRPGEVTGHLRHLLGELITRFGRDHPIDMGSSVLLEAPHARLVTGIKPKTLGDLEDIAGYCEEEITQLLSCCHTGQEGDPLDLESKVLHAGMIDHVAMEVADIAQVSALGMPKGEPEPSLTDIGYGAIDSSKPVIMCIGHNVLPSIDIIDYLMDHDLFGQVEVGGLCCTAHDMSRYNKRAKIVGPISWQLRFIRAGIPDLIVVDEQCIRTDVVQEAKAIGVPVIATSEKSCLGLPDMTAASSDTVVDDLLLGSWMGH
jgi:acetyl-CoA decarbonylase/synthase complex subunit alpha